MPQRVDHNCSHVRFFENALAVSLVEPMFTILLKSLLIFILGNSIPGFGMKFTPGLEFFFPAAKDILWDSVGESKSHEVRSITQFPMWQVTPVFLNLCVRVQGMKLRGRIIQRDLRFGRRDARLPH